MAARLGDEQAHVRLHAYGVGRGVDREELLRIIGGREPETAADRQAGALRAAVEPVGPLCLLPCVVYSEAALAALGSLRSTLGRTQSSLLECAASAGPACRYLGLMVLDEAPW